MTQSSQSALSRMAYGAIGVPSSMFRRLVNRLDESRTTIQGLGDKLADSSRTELDKWAAEGQAIVDTVMARFTGRLPDDLDDIPPVRSVKLMADASRTAGITLSEPTVALSSIHGVGPTYARRLEAAGVLTTNALVARMSDEESTARLAKTTDINVDQLRAWAGQADLTRVKGIGDEYRKLLQWSGIGSIRDLADSSLRVLTSAMEETRTDLNLDVALPSQSTVSDWIASARGLLS